MTKTRLEAFSDAVIAIIMTIMVLEMKVPHGTEWTDLTKVWPIFLSYAVSFTNLGIYWGNHHHLIHTIKEVKGGILWANMHLLFWMSLMPFATGWMGENHFALNTVLVYCILATLTGIAYYILLSIIKKCNPGNSTLQVVWKKQTRKGFISVVMYLIAAGLCFVHPGIAGVIVILVAIMWLMPDRNIERAMDHT